MNSKSHFIYLLTVLLVFSCADKHSKNKAQMLPTKVQEALDSFPIIEGIEKHQAMVFGTFHFNRNMDASDIVGKNHIDVMSSENQEELEEVVDKIVNEFKPTMVAVEWMPKLQPTFDSLYQKYLAGDWKLSRHESIQIGFRVAKRLGLSGVVCIDNRPTQPESVLSMDDWDLYAKEIGHEEIWHDFDDENLELNKYMDSMISRLSVKEYLQFLNQKKIAKRFKQLWVTGMVNLGQGDKYPGADLTGHWFQRNTRIFANIRALMEKEAERVLIIYGQSHKWILDDLLEASPEIELIQPLF